MVWGQVTVRIVKGQGMNTPAHMLLGAALFGRGGEGRLLWAAVLGALAPDASLYLMAGVSLFVLAVPPQVVFDQLYFSETWQTVFAVDNSVFLWGGLLGLAVWRRWHLGIAFAGAGLLHLALDFPLHAGDGRPHFWPLSDWVFDAPVSYWDSTHHATWVAPVTVMICVVAYVTIWRKRVAPLALAGFGLLLATELWVMRQWLVFF